MSVILFPGRSWGAGPGGPTWREGLFVQTFIHSFIHSSFSAFTHYYALGLYLFSFGGSLRSSRAIIYLRSDYQHVLCLRRWAGVTTIDQGRGTGAVSGGMQVWVGRQERGSSLRRGECQERWRGGDVVLKNEEEEETPRQAEWVPGEGTAEVRRSLETPQ